MKPEQELRFLKIMELGLNELGAHTAEKELRKLHDEVEADLNARDRLCRCGDERYKHEDRPGVMGKCRGYRFAEADGEFGSPCFCTEFEAAP